MRGVLLLVMILLVAVRVPSDGLVMFGVARGVRWSVYANFRDTWLNVGFLAIVRLLGVLKVARVRPRGPMAGRLELLFRFLGELALMSLMMLFV